MTFPSHTFPDWTFPDGTFPGTGGSSAYSEMPSHVLASYLIDFAGAFTDPDDSDSWPLYKNGLPDGNGVSNDIAAIFDTSGVLDGKTMQGEETERYGLQLRVRALDNIGAWQKINAVVNTLVSIHSVDVTVNDRVFVIQNVTRTSGPVRIVVDQKRRSHWVVNFLMRMKEV